MTNGKRDNAFKLQSIMAGFNNQVEYLRVLGNIDLRIFTGYITLQLILAGWLSKLQSATYVAKLGFLLIDLSLSVVAAFLLVMNDKRRSAALKTFINIIDAMGFNEPGEYLPEKPLFAGKRAPSSLPWYLVSIVISTIGVSLVLFTVNATP
jgi:hypothetical protein